MKIKYLIIGGGVTGLSFANFIDDDYLILEKEDELGGYCRSIKKDGYIWDYSGHFFHFKNKDIDLFFKTRMPENSLLKIIKKSKIVYGDRWIDFPFQKNIHQLEKNDFIDCLYYLYFKESKTLYANFKEMMYGKFGKSIAEKFLIPYNEKLYSCDIEELDVEAMGRFFPDADISAIIRNMKIENNESYNSSFYYPVDGASQFIKALKSDLNDDRIMLNTKVLNIDIENKYVVDNKGKKIYYERLVSTVPLYELLKMLGWESMVKCLKWSKVLVFNMGFDKKGPEKIHWLYFPEKKYNFYRIGFYDNILNSDKMSLYVEIGGSSCENFDVQKHYGLVMDGLSDLGILDKQELKSWVALQLNPAYVHVTSESKKFFEKINKILNLNAIYSIGRYGGWKYCSIEDNVIESRNLARSLNVKKSI